MPLFEEDKEVNNRQKILEVATRLVMEKGVKGTSLADIAREAGLSKGTLFYHFPTKDELVYELTIKHFDWLIQGFLQRMDDVKEEKMEKVIYDGLNLILQAKERGKLNLYLLQEAFMGNDELKEKFKETYTRYRSIMKGFLKSLTGKEEKENDIRSIMLVALIDGLIIQWLIQPESVDVEKIALMIAGDLKRF